MSPLPHAYVATPFAHRGYHDSEHNRPENSRAAIRAAITAGYGIEIDVQLSADQQAMVFHDYHLARLTAEQGPVRQRRAAELSQINLTGADEGIPMLAEVLEIASGKVPLLIEIKDQDGMMGPDLGPLESAVAEAVLGYRGPVAVMSFNPHAVAILKDLAPVIPRGLTTSAFSAKDWPLLSAATRDHLRGIGEYDRVGACFISHKAADLARPRVGELKSMGATILCWTIHSEAEEAAARTCADNITFEGYSATIPAP